MKKSLLSLALSVGALTAFSQVVVFDVLTPEEVAGNYFIEYTPGGSAGWALVPDLTVPENSIEGELVFAVDGTAADSLACEPLVNPAEVDGKIAMIYRGVCPFALKAKHAHEAGAIGVMLINNLPGVAPIVPGAAAGGDGELVDIPIAMTAFETGQLLKPHVNAGTATAFLGAVTFENDLTLNGGMVLRPQGAVFPAAIAQNASEFSVPIGSYIENSGTLAQTGVSLTATITYNGTEIYSETGGNETIQPGEDVFIALPTFSQDNYPIGVYELVYSIDADAEDEFPLDNAPLNASFTISENVYSFSPWNPDNDNIQASPGYRPGTWNAFYEPCIHFRDPNASRLRLLGLTFGASTDADDTLEGKFFETTAYTWDDNFESYAEFGSIEDVPIEDLNDFSYGIYDYIENAQNELVYVPFDNQDVLEDNRRYLFCVTSTYNTAFILHAPASYDYTASADFHQQPTFPWFNGGGVALEGFAPGNVYAPALGVHFEDLTTGLTVQNKVDITPFPNPTMDYIAIPYDGSAATANMMIYDNAGKLVKSTNVNFAGSNMIQVNMAGLPNGNYVFNMQFNDGTTSTFKVVVAR